MQITIEEADWGGAVGENIRVLLADVQDRFLEHLAKPPTGRVVVRSRPEAGSPRVLYRRTRDEDYIVELTAQGNHWAQYAYQFSHEFCHILTDYDRLHESANKWFHETLCETASLFAVSRSAETWRTRPPYPNWASYSSSLAKYADDVIKKPARRLPAGMDVRTWITEHEPSLRADPAQRDLNGVIANQLLPLFQREPTGWEAVRHLPNSDSNFWEYLAEWEKSAPGRSAEFVAGLRSALEGPTGGGKRSGVSAAVGL